MLPLTENQISNFKSRLVSIEGGCMVWTGAMCGNYGRVGFNNKLYSAHRASFAIAKGEIPNGMVVRHTCDNPPCCNPDHLILGTYKENSDDMVLRGRCAPACGERSGNHKLTVKLVSEIKQALIDGILTQSQIADKHGISNNAVNAIRMGYTWANVPPFIPSEIPMPHRKMSDADYLDIRQAWRDGATLNQLAEKYSTRKDSIQAIICGKRGKNVPVGERLYRQNKHKLSESTRLEILRRYEAGETQRALAMEYGMSKNGINLMILRMKESYR